MFLRLTDSEGEIVLVNVSRLEAVVQDDETGGGWLFLASGKELSVKETREEIFAQMEKLDAMYFPDQELDD